MRTSTFLFFQLGALITSVACATTRVNSDNSVIVFDSIAFENDASRWTAPLRSYVYKRQLNVTPVVEEFETALTSVGVEVGDKLATLEERATLFAADPLAGKEVDVIVAGCAGSVTEPMAMSATSADKDDIGMMERNTTLGVCGDCEDSRIGYVKLSKSDRRDVNFTVYPSPPEGWGIISDIDDSIKVTEVLNTVKLLENTLLNDPEPVSGMPDVFSGLKMNLKDPQVIYLSGSPFQLYPMLRSFIADYYPPGPVLLKNLTYTGVSSVLSSGNETTLSYKVREIDEIHGWYPEKKFLGLGDSTQSDPEVYSTAYHKYGGEFISCIWIRVVDGANNTDARFAAAFEGIPSTKYRTFVNATELLDIDVAGGSC